MTFNIYINGAAVTHALTLAEAAQMLQLDLHEIEWAIEEFGRCDVLDDSGRELTVVAHGGNNG